MNDQETKNNKLMTSVRASTWFAIGIIVTQIVLAIVTYPWLPEQMPAHWNVAGEVDRYLSRMELAISLPAASAILYILSSLSLRFVPLTEGRMNRQALGKISEYLLCGVLLLLLGIQIMTIAIGFQLPVDVTFVVTMCLAFLCIFLGNHLGKVQRNLILGIRTPWTLSNDRVWERTHRVGAWLFVTAGIVMLLLNFFAPLRVFAAIGPLLIVVVFLTIYSYWVHRRWRMEQQ